MGGMHRDVFIEPIDEHDDAFFNVHHHDPYKQHMPEGPTAIPFRFDHHGHAQVAEGEEIELPPVAPLDQLPHLDSSYDHHI